MVALGQLLRDRDADERIRMALQEVAIVDWL